MRKGNVVEKWILLFLVFWGGVVGNGIAVKAQDVTVGISKKDRIQMVGVIRNPVKGNLEDDAEDQQENLEDYVITEDNKKNAANESEQTTLEEIKKGIQVKDLPSIIIIGVVCIAVGIIGYVAIKKSKRKE